MLGFYSGYVICLPKPNRTSAAGDVSDDVARANPYLMHIQGNMFITPFPPTAHDPMHVGERKSLDEITEHVFCFMNENVHDPEKSKVKPTRDTLALTATSMIKNGSIVDMNYCAKEESVVYEVIRLGRMREQGDFLRDVWKHVGKLWAEGAGDRDEGMSINIAVTRTEVSVMQDVIKGLQPSHIVGPKVKLNPESEIGKIIASKLKDGDVSLREAVADMADILTMLWRLQTDEEITTSDRGWWKNSSLMARAEEESMLVAMRTAIAPLIITSTREKFKLRRPEEVGPRVEDIEAAAEVMLRMGETWKPEKESTSWKYCTKTHKEVLAFANARKEGDVGK